MKLADFMNQMGLTDIYRSFDFNTKEYTFFSASQEKFSKSDNIVGHKANNSLYFSDHD
jgi:exonuclease III